jgi:hypothetical protein
MNFFLNSQHLPSIIWGHIAFHRGTFFLTWAMPNPISTETGPTLKLQSYHLITDRQLHHSLTHPSTFLLIQNKSERAQNTDYTENKPSATKTSRPYLKSSRIVTQPRALHLFLTHQEEPAEHHLLLRPSLHSPCRHPE